MLVVVPGVVLGVLLVVVVPGEPAPPPPLTRYPADTALEEKSDEKQ